ncbi:olfactory receptor 5G29-like [Pelobates fuscus]|uniref:olfactory receptor 5G29-like n=1 Tax=Pelobates fuscus TaxID=191477 RepID=UPI002FE43978
MLRTNHTSVKEFFLLGFELQNFKIPLFLFFLLLYTVTVTGNILVIALVYFTPTLHSPMYFFLSHLSWTDIFLTTNVIPNLLCLILNEGGSISLVACLTQLQCIGGSMVVECLLLAVMSYDRYLAICYPLRYNSIMDRKFCLHLVSWPWVFGIMVALTIVGLVSRLQFCDSNMINHFFCDVTPLLKLSCSEIFFIQTGIFIASSSMTLLPFVFIISTYISIFWTIFRISSSNERHKTFSTCSSHLAIVSMYYGSLFALYVIPDNGNSVTLYKYLSLMYTQVTPFFNPVIYSLRNKTIRTSLLKMIQTTIRTFP